MAMAYLTYDEYVGLGGSAEQARFQVLELQARKTIDRSTDSRVQKMAAVPDAVKICATELINLESKAGTAAQLESPAITSFNADGYSESYKAVSADDIKREQRQVIQTLLYGETDDRGVPLLYRGLRT